MSPRIKPSLRMLFWEIVDRIIHIFTARSKLVLPFMENVLMFRAGYMIWDTCQYVRDENLSKSGGRLSIYYLHGFFIIFWKLNIFYHITFYHISKYREILSYFFYHIFSFPNCLIIFFIIFQVFKYDKKIIYIIWLGL